MTVGKKRSGVGRFIACHTNTKAVLKHGMQYLVIKFFGFGR